jgi:hypothetical protein
MSDVASARAVRRIVRHWSDEEADWRYRLERHHEPSAGHPDGWWATVGECFMKDYDWAMRTALHYGIEVPQ